MDLLTLCTCCLISTVVIFAVALILGQKRMRQVENVMRQLAERHEAQFTPGTIILNPYITFTERKLELRLIAALGGRDDPSHTELVAKIPTFPAESAAATGPDAVRPHLRLRPHSFSTRLTITLGAKPYLTGDQPFDAAFDLRGQPEALLRSAFTPEIRHKLLELKANRPSVRLGRWRSWLPARPVSGQPFRLRWLPPQWQYRFYTTGLPAELAEWEPRLQAGRALLKAILDWGKAVED